MKKVLYILGQLEDTDMEWILGAGRKERIAEGTVLIQENTDLDRIFIVIDGLLQVTLESHPGLVLARLRQGEIVGEMSLLDEGPTTATVTALEDSVVFSVDRTLLRAKVQNDTGFAARFYRALCVFLINRLSRTSARVAEPGGAAAADPAEDSTVAGPGGRVGWPNVSELLDPSDLDWLREQGRREQVPAGQVLIREGRALEDLYLLEEGRLRVSLEAQGGAVLAMLGEGQIVGEMSLLDSRPPTATVTAAAPSVVLAIPHAALASRLARDPDFSSRTHRALGMVLADRLGRTSALLGRGRAPTLKDDEREEDEISPEALDNVSLAGARFDWFLRELRVR